MTALSVLLVLLPFVLSPGASFALTVRGAASGDRAAGLRVGLGTAGGTAAIAAVAGISGVGVWVASDTSTRAWFEIVGGVLLVGFGVAPLVRTWRRRRRIGSQPTGVPPGRLVAWALVAVVTNVKALTLYFVVVPSMIPDAASPLGGYAMVAAVHIALLFVWLTLITVLITRVPAISTNPRVTVALQLAASGALIVLGVQSSVSGIFALM